MSPAEPASTDGGDALGRSLAHAVHTARRARGLTIAELAERAGVSGAMISKIERGRSQPTAVLLGRLSGALSLTLSELIASAEQGDSRLSRASERLTWTDPETGYVRRRVSPAAGAALELIEITLPAHRSVAMPAESYAFIHQQIWVLDGTLLFTEGSTETRLRAGDCLALGPPAPCVFANPEDRPCRYLVAIARR